MMAFQMSVAVRNARVNSIPTTVGASAVLKIFSGAEPADCAAADPSGLLASITLPATWYAAASSGTGALTGSWTGSASAAGTAASFRIYDSTGATCHLQGSCSLSGAGGDMILTNTNLAAGQPVSVTSFNITDGNA
jgi:hypothetical protein